MNKRFKTPLLLGLIGSSITFIIALVGLIFLANHDNFLAFFVGFIGQEIDVGVTLEDALIEMFPSLKLSTLSSIFYIANIIFSLFSMILTIPCIVCCIICFKDTTLDIEEFDKRNKLHIFLMISYGISYIGNSFESGSYAITEISFLSLISVALLFIALFKTIQTIRINKYLLKIQKSKQAHEEKMKQEQEMFEKEKSSFSQSQGNQIGEENLEKPEVKEETNTIDQAKLDELYTLLSKLEKSYKSGEITQENYERMKKTILENYMN